MKVTLKKDAIAHIWTGDKKALLLFLSNSNCDIRNLTFEFTDYENGDSVKDLHINFLKNKNEYSVYGRSVVRHDKTKKMDVIIAYANGNLQVVCHSDFENQFEKIIEIEEYLKKDK